MSSKISSFRELRVSKMAFELQQELFMEKCLRIGQMWGTMLAHPDKFCHRSEE